MACGSSMDDIRTFAGSDLESVCDNIGSGGMGVVSLYKWKVEDPAYGITKGQRVAVKKLEKSSDIQSIKEEARILWRIQGKCRHILRFYGLKRSSNGRISLILEYMEHGNVSQFFKAIKERVRGNSTSLWPLKRRITSQICDGMDFLHQRQPRPILHCDLKAANVLLDCDLNVKICDFGLATIKRLTKRTMSDDISKERLMNHPAGTLSHVAPELLSAKSRQNKKSDVYSFGVLVWELLSDRTPYEDVFIDCILSSVVREGRRPKLAFLPPDSPKILKDMMMDSWDQCPEFRPDFSELRRRFSVERSRHAMGNTEVEKSVTLAKQAWEREPGSETTPKVVRSQDLPATESQDVSDLLSDDVQISDLSKSDEQSDKTELTQQAHFDDRVPLVGDHAPRHPRIPRTPTKFKKCCTVGLIFCISVFCTAGFFIGRYALPNTNKLRQCPALKNPANGGSMQCTNGNYENSECSFSCPENSRLRLPGDNVSDYETSDSFDLTCQHDRIMNFEWSGKEPYCEKVATCPSPTSDQTVQLDCTPPESTSKSKSVGRNFANQNDQTYSNGTICHFSCPSRTSLETNETTALCLGDATWNTTSSAQCIEGCPFFEDPANSNHTCTLGRKYDSRCVFTCEENFVMVGTGNMVCASAGPVGHWTNKPPRCECPACRSGKKCENTLVFQQTWAQMNSSGKMEPTMFDGRNIVCYSKQKVYLKKNPEKSAFGCQCKDTKTNEIKQCNDDSSLSEACYKTYASLILMMVYNETVSLPCDAETMPGICK